MKQVEIDLTGGGRSKKRRSSKEEAMEEVDLEEKAEELNRKLEEELAKLEDEEEADDSVNLYRKVRREPKKEGKGRKSDKGKKPAAKDGVTESGHGKKRKRSSHQKAKRHKNEEETEETETKDKTESDKKDKKEKKIKRSGRSAKTKETADTDNPESDGLTKSVTFVDSEEVSKRKEKKDRVQINEPEDPVDVPEEDNQDSEPTKPDEVAHAEVPEGDNKPESRQTDKVQIYEQWKPTVVSEEANKPEERPSDQGQIDEQRKTDEGTNEAIVGEVLITAPSSDEQKTEDEGYEAVNAMYEYYADQEEEEDVTDNVTENQAFTSENISECVVPVVKEDEKKEDSEAAKCGRRTQSKKKSPPKKVHFNVEEEEKNVKKKSTEKKEKIKKVSVKAEVHAAKGENRGKYIEDPDFTLDKSVVIPHERRQSTRKLKSLRVRDEKDILKPKEDLPLCYAKFDLKQSVVTMPKVGIVKTKAQLKERPSGIEIVADALEIETKSDKRMQDDVAEQQLKELASKKNCVSIYDDDEDEPAEIYRCEYPNCGEESQSLVDHIRHNDTHTDTYCHICEFQFDTDELITEHWDSVHPELNFKTQNKQEGSQPSQHPEQGGEAQDLIKGVEGENISCVTDKQDGSNETDKDQVKDDGQGERASLSTQAQEILSSGDTAFAGIFTVGDKVNKDTHKEELYVIVKEESSSEDLGKALRSAGEYDAALIVASVEGSGISCNESDCPGSATSCPEVTGSDVTDTITSDSTYTEGSGTEGDNTETGKVTKADGENRNGDNIHTNKSTDGKGDSPTEGRNGDKKPTDDNTAEQNKPGEDKEETETGGSNEAIKTTIQSTDEMKQSEEEKEGSQTESSNGDIEITNQSTDEKKQSAEGKGASQTEGRNGNKKPTDESTEGDNTETGKVTKADGENRNGDNIHTNKSTDGKGDSQTEGRNGDKKPTDDNTAEQNKPGEDKEETENGDKKPTDESTAEQNKPVGDNEEIETEGSNDFCVTDKTVTDKSVTDNIETAQQDESTLSGTDDGEDAPSSHKESSMCSGVPLTSLSESEQSDDNSSKIESKESKDHSDTMSTSTLKESDAPSTDVAPSTSDSSVFLPKGKIKKISSDTGFSSMVEEDKKERAVAEDPEPKEEVSNEDKPVEVKVVRRKSIKSRTKPRTRASERVEMQRQEKQEKWRPLLKARARMNLRVFTGRKRERIMSPICSTTSHTDIFTSKSCVEESSGQSPSRPGIFELGYAVESKEKHGTHRRSDVSHTEDNAGMYFYGYLQHRHQMTENIKPMYSTL